MSWERRAHARNRAHDAPLLAIAEARRGDRAAVAEELDAVRAFDLETPALDVENRLGAAREVELAGADLDLTVEVDPAETTVGEKSGDAVTGAGVAQGHRLRRVVELVESERRAEAFDEDQLVAASGTIEHPPR